MTHGINNLPWQSFVPLLGQDRTYRKIEDIVNTFRGDAKITIDRDDESDDEFVEFLHHGVSLHFMSNLLVSVCFHSNEKDCSYSTFKGCLPHELSFDCTKEAILKSLGQPCASGGGKNGFFGYAAEWVKYQSDDHQLHIQFSSDSQRIVRVTLMKKDYGK